MALVQFLNLFCISGHPYKFLGVLNNSVKFGIYCLMWQLHDVRYNCQS